MFACSTTSSARVPYSGFLYSFNRAGNGLFIIGREVKQLIESITSLIDNLEKLFPASQALVRQETAEIHDKQTLGVLLVESAAQDVDSLLQASVKEAPYWLSVLVVPGRRGQRQGSDWGRTK